MAGLQDSAGLGGGGAALGHAAKGEMSVLCPGTGLVSFSPQEQSRSSVRLQLGGSGDLL